MSSSSPSSYSKNTSGHKIPQFDEKNFTMWKSKSMMILETMNYSMMDIIKYDPYVPMHQLMKDNIKEGDEVEKPAHEFNQDNARLVALDVKARVAIGNALLYDIYHFV